jgi:hypothetical protein
MKDLIIGAADKYDWSHIKIWARSIKESGFAGDVVLIAYRVTENLIEQCKKLGIIVVQANHDESGNLIDHNHMGIDTQSHRLRNFHMWQFLNESDEKYRMVAVTDTRDIVFQRDPSDFFDFIDNAVSKIYMPSEAIAFENEEWNGNMVLRLFGPFIYSQIKNKAACNSGTVFGRYEEMKEFLLNMYLIAKNFNATGSDQPTMNVLGYLIFHKIVTSLPMDRGYACQCGTVLDPTKPHLWANLTEPQPKILPTGIVVNSKMEQFVLVHQYDRVPELKQLVEYKYEC